MWLNQNFLLVDEFYTDTSLDVNFLCLRALPKTQLLSIRMDHNGEVFRKLLFVCFFSAQIVRGLGVEPPSSF